MGVHVCVCESRMCVWANDGGQVCVCVYVCVSMYGCASIDGGWPDVSSWCASHRLCETYMHTAIVSDDIFDAVVVVESSYWKRVPEACFAERHDGGCCVSFTNEASSWHQTSEICDEKD